MGKITNVGKVFREQSKQQMVLQRCFLNFSCGASVKTLSSLLVIQFVVIISDVQFLWFGHDVQRHEIHVLHIFRE